MDWKISRLLFDILFENECRRDFGGFGVVNTSVFDRLMPREGFLTTGAALEMVIAP